MKGALDQLCKRLIGRDSREIVSILDDLDRAMLGNNQAKSGIDCALHDLRARTLGIPICDLFGGPAVREFASLRILPSGEIWFSVQEDNVVYESCSSEAFRLFAIAISVRKLGRNRANGCNPGV